MLSLRSNCRYRALWILVPYEDSLFLKILWRNSSQEPIRIYNLNTATFETACVPFLAIRTLYQLAEDERESFPIASTILKRNFYVDATSLQAHKRFKRP